MTAEGGGASRVGIVGPPEGTVAALDDAGTAVVADDPRTVLDADPDVLVGVGESALLSLARERPDAPILPVDAGAGVRSVPADRLDDAAARLIAGEWATDRHPLLRVTTPGGRDALALMDAMVVTAEPAHISEFALTADGEHVARFRADGVVVATPAGTRGYARAAGAPVIPPGAGVLGIVPVAAFATTLDHWVVPASGVTVTVVRDEATVEVLADDRTVGTTAVDEPVRLSPAGAIRTVRVPEGRSPFDRQGRELETL